MNTDLIVRFIQNIRVYRCSSVVYKYTNLACSTLAFIGCNASNELYDFVWFTLEYESY